MQLEVQVYLKEILNAIEEIDSYFDGYIREFIFFVSDKKTQRAIERNLEIIGEAANRIYKISPDIQIPDIRLIIETRNRIIHGYDNISAEIIWSIIERDLPSLREEIQKLLTV
jgi:uncharacterized protein with HEPN domain